MNFLLPGHVLKYDISPISLSKIKFNNKNNLFFQRLKEKVNLYFERNHISSTGNVALYLKSVLLLCSAASLYISLVFLHPDTFLAVLLCILLGSNLAGIGFNIMHEGGHQSFSKSKWMNRLSAYFLNILGGNALFWKMKHNINHHTYTNIEGMDGDIEVEPFMRLHLSQKKYWAHRFQHIYWVILYGISYFSWVFIDDFTKYFSGKVTSGSVPMKWELKEHFIFWGTKLAYMGLYLGVPIAFVGIVHTLIGFAILTFACGLSIAIVFQMAHVVEDTVFISPTSDTEKVEEEWAVHQIRTTANFGTGNKLLCWLLGGLNFQVEHHLFPKISHVHYPALNQLVKETCKEFNLTYLEYPSLFRAFCSHLMHIKKMGIA
jgi:linoleoyl-CoA desaturase